MKVSVVIPNRNDTVMLSVTVRSVLENLRSFNGESEIIVVDNSDEDVYNVLKVPSCSPLAFSEKNFRLLRQDFPSMHSARQMGFESAKGDYLLMSDSHVLWGHNVIKDVVEFMDNTPECMQAFSPVGWLDLPAKMAKSTLQPNKEGGIYGPWGGKPATTPHKIPWFFGFRVARRKFFLQDCDGYGFFARKRVSWGGGEFYAAMKTWLMGGECWTVPTAPCFHIGPFNKHVAKVANYRFRTYGASGNGRQGIGILAAFYALGGDRFGWEDAVKNRKAFEQYGNNLERDWEEAKELAGSDRQWIKEHQKISYEELINTEPWKELP